MDVLYVPIFCLNISKIFFTLNSGLALQNLFLAWNNFAKFYMECNFLEIFKELKIPYFKMHITEINYSTTS